MNSESQYCPHCHLLRATPQDWKRIPEGEGGHLCWSFEDSCNREPEDVGPELQKLIFTYLSEVTEDESRGHNSSELQRKSQILKDLIIKRFF